MKRTVAASLLLLSSSIAFSASTPFTDDQKKAIESMIHDYLVNQPEVLIEASQSLQLKQQQKIQAEVQGLVKTHADALFQDKYTTVGNPKGTVTLVEFFDYQCGHCKKMASVVSSVMEKSPNLRIIYKEFPIFGEQSTMITKAALAAAMQEKYLPMHDALLTSKQTLNEQTILKIAKSLNLNIEKFNKDMKSAAVQKEVDENRKLAEALHLMGTPAFIVASTPDGVYKPSSKPITFIPGATSETALLEIVKNAG